MVQAIFKVTDMNCANCAMKLQEMEDNIPGIHQVDASYKKQELIVKFDETMIGEEQIITAAKEIGYTAIKL